MAIKCYPDPVLRRPAQPVQPGSPEAQTAIAALRQAFREVQALGLAANQIGLPYRVVLVRLGEEEKVLLNPVIVERSPQLVEDWEACLSLPGVDSDVPRAEWVVVRAQDEEGRPVELKLEGLEARVMQHEVDHLDGVLYVDHLPVDERREVLRAYRSAQEKQKEQPPSPEQS